LAIFKYRVLSRVDIYDAFVACSFTIFIWTFYRIFNRVPSWLINLNIWEVLSVSAYALTIALFESILVFSFFALIGILLPAQYFLNKFVSHTTMIVFTSSLWAVAAQFNYALDYRISCLDPNHLWLHLFLRKVCWVGSRHRTENQYSGNFLYHFRRCRITCRRHPQYLRFHVEIKCHQA
jgi:hypothetical protein